MRGRGREGGRGEDEGEDRQPSLWEAEALPSLCLRGPEVIELQDSPQNPEAAPPLLHKELLTWVLKVRRSSSRTPKFENQNRPQWARACPLASSNQPPQQQRPTGGRTRKVIPKRHKESGFRVSRMLQSDQCRRGDRAAGNRHRLWCLLSGVKEENIR
ncbi:unnamed protein product [Pleuronectes platessa]|uniref:Uncharacterized protein n=1 Tax=Pleuronectes platessa TaxID=8262 RepID=A0A9N7UD78_PLEPL|nr:unnamed protein product [Pleuronectes platessa]